MAPVGAYRNRADWSGVLGKRMQELSGLQVPESKRPIPGTGKGVEIVGRHCVSRDFKMSAGIAVKFKEKFGSIGDLLTQNARVGGVASIKQENRYIYYLVTKEGSSDKPTYDNLETSLIELYRQTQTHNVRKLAIPKLGCGLDHLEWTHVREIICKIFAKSNIEIVVYHQKSSELKNPKTEKETLTFVIASLNDVPPDNLLHCRFHIEGSPLTLLVDTGAGISIIHKSKIGSNKLDNSNPVSIVGISSTQASIQSYGRAKIELDDLPAFTFHIANLNIKADGIIGNDFLTKFNAQIYVQSKTMHIRDKTYKLQHLSECADVDTVTNKQTLNSRAETVISCRTRSLKSGDAIVESQTIDTGVIIPRAIVAVQDWMFITTCVNTTEEDCVISTPTIDVDPIDTKLQTIHNLNSEVSRHNKSYVDTPERREQVLRLIRNQHLNTEEAISLEHIISEYTDIFYLDGDRLTYSNFFKHRIPTSSDIPIRAKTYRLPPMHEQEVKQQIQKMLDQDIIQPSSSPWNSPIWVVPKKPDASGKQKWRIVVDYRALNTRVPADSYPIPNITDILDKLGHSQYFTTLDLASGFHQIEIEPHDTPKTAFSTPYGHLEWKRCPMGLRNVPNSFQRTMDCVLHGLQGERCFVYLDDIVVFAASLQEHEVKLREVFSRLRKYQLKVQPDKCEFLRREVMYLGHIISEKGVRPNPEKIRAVLEYPTPKTCKDIKSFLGLTGYYHRFIKDYSKIVKPLTRLLKKNVTFFWDSPQEIAFKECKRILTTPPILQYPDFSKEFLLTTDASMYALGSTLSQGEIGKDLPISYASRTLNQAETHYSTIERELLSIVWSVKHFRPYLYGRKFKIITDHRPLTYLFSIKDPGSRLIRWRLKLEEFDYEVVYKAGKYNTNADALSRPPITQTCVATGNEVEHVQEKPDDYLQMNYRFFQEKRSDYNFDTPNLKMSGSQLLEPTHKNIYIPVSCQLSDQNKLFNEAIADTCEQPPNPEIKLYLDKQKRLYDADLVTSRAKQNLFFCCTRTNYFDPWEAENYFKSLLSCLQKHDITTLHVPNLKTDRTYLSTNNEQIHITAYLADVYNCEITICENRVTYPSLEERPNILKTYHDDPLAGHRGITETTRKIRDVYFWKGMTNDIKIYIDNCVTCQRNKIQRKTFQAPLVITSQATEPFERVSMDLVSYSDISDNNNKYILTMQDELTRYVQAYPIADKEALTVAKQILHYCQHYGVPKRFHSDQGTEFMNSTLKQLMKFFGSNHTFNTAYHPQTNGALERFHACLRDHIRMYHSRRLKNWDQIIPFAIMCHNTSTNTSTGYTPYELLFGYKPRPLYSLKPVAEYVTSEYIRDLNERLKVTRETALRNIEAMKEKSKERYDNKIKNIADFQIGSKVMLRIPNPNNLEPKWEGPYEVTRIGFNGNYIIRKSGKNNLVHANRLRPFAP